jgi:hypothetical protein
VAAALARGGVDRPGYRDHFGLATSFAFRDGWPLPGNPKPYA